MELLRGALMFANGATLGAILLSGGLMAEDAALGFWCMIGAMSVSTLLSFVSLPVPRDNAAPVRGALLFGAGLCAPLGAGALYFKDTITWAAVDMQALVLLIVIGGVSAFMLMLVVMDRIRKADEKRDLRARGELQ
ncbi:MAG: hypothetical protein JNL81_02245 [Hyphomonadaceae bacterium]|nr:hypothetical protein [Hyphomonadaceae bacterium]